jgi:hypothetical protein
MFEPIGAVAFSLMGTGQRPFLFRPRPAAGRLNAGARCSSGHFQSSYHLRYRTFTYVSTYFAVIAIKIEWGMIDPEG